MPTSLQLLGHLIREARKARKMSQEDLALAGDIAPNYMGGVERGGSWSTSAKFTRCADRNYYAPSNGGINFGFRCVRGL